MALFLVFAGPYRPQTKGKIENMVKFVKRDFFIGWKFQILLRSQLTAPSNGYSMLTQPFKGTTHEIPIERLKIECLNQIDGVLPYKIVRKSQEKYQRMHFYPIFG